MSGIHRDEARRLVDALDREIRNRGRGAVRAMERAVGHSKSWWSHRVTAGDITLRQTFQILDHLGIDPVNFVRRTFAGDRAPRVDQPRGEAPEIVTAAWERIHSDTDSGTLDASIVESLDQRIFEAPEDVVRIAHWAVDSVDIEVLPPLLGVAGAAWRLMNELSAAEHAIHGGIEIARALSGAVPGNLLVRLGSVLADRGDVGEALHLAERAAVLHLQEGDGDGLGRALVAQGVFFSYLDQFGKSIEVCQRAMAELDPKSKIHRLAALQLIGIALRGTGDLHSALRTINSASDLLPPNSPAARGKLLWIQAGIQADLGELARAVETLEEVRDIYREIHPGECCLATCDLVKLKLKQGHATEAYELATSIRALVEPLSPNPVVSAAIGDLLRSGKAGLSLALLERVVAKVEGERQRRQNWRALGAHQPPGSS